MFYSQFSTYSNPRCSNHLPWDPLDPLKPASSVLARPLAHEIKPRGLLANFSQPRALQGRSLHFPLRAVCRLFAVNRLNCTPLPLSNSHARRTRAAASIVVIFEQIIPGTFSEQVAHVFVSLRAPETHAERPGVDSPSME